MVVGDFVQETDLLVIGSGPGGYVAAIRAAQQGRQVLLVERTTTLGGVCLQRGCIPSKALISVAKRYTSLRDAEEMGLGNPNVPLDWQKMMQWKQGVVSQLEQGVKQLMAANKIEVVVGEARFVSEDTVRVATETAGQTYQFRQAIIATGSRPASLPGVEWDERIVSSTGCLSLPELPKQLLVIGGGYIGLELGTAYAKLGSKVTLLEGSPSLLPTVEPALVKVVRQRLAAYGVEVVEQARVEAVERAGEGVRVKVAGKSSPYTAAYCLIAIGRQPNTADLGLASVGVECSANGFIQIDDHCLTSNPKIYAIGDCAGGDLLAHKASLEAMVAVDAACGGGAYPAGKQDIHAMPYVIFSDPEIAYVGLTAEAAREKGLRPKVGRASFKANGRALTLQQAEGFVQAVVCEDTETLLGVQMVGPDVSSLLATATLAIEMGATVEDLHLTVHAHPTLPETLVEAVGNALGRAIHAVPVHR